MLELDSPKDELQKLFQHENLMKNFSNLTKIAMPLTEAQEVSNLEARLIIKNNQNDILTSDMQISENGIIETLKKLSPSLLIDKLFDAAVKSNEFEIAHTNKQKKNLESTIKNIKVPILSDRSLRKSIKKFNKSQTYKEISKSLTKPSQREGRVIIKNKSKSIQSEKQKDENKTLEFNDLYKSIVNKKKSKPIDENNNKFYPILLSEVVINKKIDTTLNESTQQKDSLSDSYKTIVKKLTKSSNTKCNLIAKPSQYNVQKNHFENKNWKNFNKKKSQFDKNFKNNNNVYRSEYELPPEVYLISF